MANVEMLLLPGVVFTLRIKSAGICVICGYNSSGFGMASSLNLVYILVNLRKWEFESKDNRAGGSHTNGARPI